MIVVPWRAEDVDGNHEHTIFQKTGHPVAAGPCAARFSARKFRRAADASDASAGIVSGTEFPLRRKWIWRNSFSDIRHVDIFRLIRHRGG